MARAKRRGYPCGFYQTLPSGHLCPSAASDDQAVNQLLLIEDDARGGLERLQTPGIELVILARVALAVGAHPHGAGIVEQPYSRTVGNGATPRRDLSQVPPG